MTVFCNCHNRLLQGEQDMGVSFLWRFSSYRREIPPKGPLVKRDERFKTSILFITKLLPCPMPWPWTFSALRCAGSTNRTRMLYEKHRPLCASRDLPESTPPRLHPLLASSRAQLWGANSETFWIYSTSPSTPCNTWHCSLATFAVKPAMLCPQPTFHHPPSPVYSFLVVRNRSRENLSRSPSLRSVQWFLKIFY